MGIVTNLLVLAVDFHCKSKGEKLHSFHETLFLLLLLFLIISRINKIHSLNIIDEFDR